MKNIKRIIWIVVIAGLALWAIQQLKPQPVEADTALVEHGKLVVTIDEFGQTLIREPYIISAPLAGKLMRIEYEPGDPVTRGSLLATIDSADPGLLDARSEAEATARIKGAEASLSLRENEVEVHEAEFEKQQRYVQRDEERLSKGLISPPMLVDTKHNKRIAEGNLAAAKAALQVAKFELDQARAALIHFRARDSDSDPDRYLFKIPSPIDGVVTRRFLESSTPIGAGERILEIGNPNDLEIRIEVLSQDAVKIKPGQRVLIEHWGGNHNLDASITRVEPAAFTKVSALGVDEQKVYVYAEFTPGTELEKVRLGDSYHIEAQIVVWENDDVVKIPAGALFRHQQMWAAYLVTSDNKAVLTELKIGQHNGVEAEVLSGLQPGDKVVLHPGDRIEEGTQIKERSS